MEDYIEINFLNKEVENKFNKAMGYDLCPFCEETYLIPSMLCVDGVDFHMSSCKTCGVETATEDQLKLNKEIYIKYKGGMI